MKSKPSASISVNPVENGVEIAFSNSSASIDVLPSSSTIVKSDGSLTGSSAISEVSVGNRGAAGSTLLGISAIGVEIVPQAAIPKMAKERVNPTNILLEFVLFFMIFPFFVLYALRCSCTSSLIFNL